MGTGTKQIRQDRERDAASRETGWPDREGTRSDEDADGSSQRLRHRQVDDDGVRATSGENPVQSPRPPMDVLTIAKIVLRRWYVALLGIVLTAGAVYGIVESVEPTYMSAGSFLLADPSLRGEGITDAGILTHIATAQGVIGALSTGASRAELTAGRDGASYDISSSADGSVLTVEALADSPGDAAQTARGVIAGIVDEVTRRQQAADLPTDRQLRPRVLLEPSADSAVAVEVPAALGGTTVKHTVDGSVLLMQPAEGLINPYASSTFTIRVLEETLLSPVEYATVLDGRDTEYVLGQRDRDAAPVLYLEVRGEDPREIEATFSDVVDRVSAELRQRQTTAGVDESAFMTIDPLSVPVAAEVESSNLKRPLAAVLGLGGIATIALVLIVERVSGSRTRRRRVGRDEPDAGPAATQ